MNMKDAKQGVTILGAVAERALCALLATGLTWTTFSVLGGPSVALDVADRGTANVSLSRNATRSAESTATLKLTQEPDSTVVVAAYR